MKKLLCLIAVTGSVLFSQAQNPVTWNFTAKKIDSKTFEIHLTANIESGWHTYSQSTPEGGPVPTSISFAKNPLLTFDGKAKEVGAMEKHFEKLFGVQVFQFSDKVDFVQTVTLKANVKTNLTGGVEFMVCNDEMCLPPKTISFNLSLK